MVCDQGDQKQKEQMRFPADTDIIAMIMSASPTSMCYLENGAILWANQTMVDMFCGTSEDFAGRKIMDFYESAQEYERVRAIFYESLAHETVAQCDAKFKRIDGTIFDAHVRLSAPDRKSVV